MVLMLGASAVHAQEQTKMQTVQTIDVNDFQIVSDEVKEGVRYITAAPTRLKSRLLTESS